MTNNDYYRSVVIGMASLSLLLALVVVFFGPEDNIKPVEPKSNFEVVDTYKGRCDVVRWTNNQLAEYKYFLVCDK